MSPQCCHARRFSPFTNPCFSCWCSGRQQSVSGQLEELNTKFYKAFEQGNYAVCRSPIRTAKRRLLLWTVLRELRRLMASS